MGWANVPKRSRPKKRRVRCLGPFGEHTFLSADAAGQRVCAKCKERLKVKHYSPMMGCPVKEHR